MEAVMFSFFFRTAMKHLIFLLSLVFLCSLVISGCDLAQPQRQGQGELPIVQNDPLPPEVPVEQHVPPQDAEDEAVLVRAEVGLGPRGHYAANSSTVIITAPISAMFRTRERVSFFQPMEHAMNLFRATHDRLPASHEEFMEQIIRANHLRLPELPPGQEFVYDPARGELMVRRPRDAQ